MLSAIQSMVIENLKAGWVAHWNGKFNYIQNPASPDDWMRVEGSTLTSLVKRGLITKFPHKLVTP